VEHSSAAVTVSAYFTPLDTASYVAVLLSSGTNDNGAVSVAPPLAWRDDGPSSARRVAPADPLGYRTRVLDVNCGDLIQLGPQAG
jgi:hypothetical protein